MSAATHHKAKRPGAWGGMLAAMLLGGAPEAFAQSNYNGYSGPGYGTSNVVYSPDYDIAEAMPGGLMAQGVITETGYYDTNPLLTPQGAQTLYGSITSPELIITDKAPTTAITSDTVFNSNNFNLSEYSSNDAHSRISAANQMQRWGLGLQGNVDYDTTRTSEISQYSNTRVTPVRHFGGTVAPQVTYNLMPTDRVSLSGSYTSSSYDSNFFQDYNIYSATPSYTHQFDPMNAGFLQFVAQRYETVSGAANQVDTLGPAIGWSTILTPQLTATANIGLQETQQRNPSIVNPKWTTQYTFGASVTHKTQQNRATVTAARQQYPFGNGTEALLTQVQFDDSYKLNELFSLGGSAGYETAEYQAETPGSLKSLSSAGANFTYHATDHIDVITAYQYRHEQIVAAPSSANENIVTLSVAFRPQAWTL